MIHLIDLMNNFRISDRDIIKRSGCVIGVLTSSFSDTVVSWYSPFNQSLLSYSKLNKTIN